MATKKADLRDKINKKTKTKSINKSSNNKQVKKVSKARKNATTKQKKEQIHKKEVEIKLIKDEVTSNLIEEKVKNKSTKNKTNRKNLETAKKIKNTSEKRNKKNEEKEQIQEATKTIQKKKTLNLEKSARKKKEKSKRITFKSHLNKLLQFLKRKKYYVLSFIITLILIIVLLFVLQNSDEKIFFSFKEYNLGTKVTLSDNSIWYVVEDSNSEKSKVTLLSEKVLDINKDKKINDKDKVVYDKDNKCVYDTKKEKNIGYFLENDVKSLLKEINGISEIRLLTSDEYINIRKTMDFGYDWKEGNWLASESLDSWWLETSKYNKIYTVTKRGSYKLSEAKSKNYVRLVIIVDKSSVK